MDHTLSIFPLGDAAITIDLGHLIDEELNRKAVAIQQWLLSSTLTGIADIIVSYSSVSVFYDPVVLRTQAPAGQGAFEFMREKLEQAWQQSNPQASSNEEPVRISVCYDAEYGPDLKALSISSQLSVEEVIHLHTKRVYRVYMIGFLPGFTYLGKVDPRLATPRKTRPVPVLAGSVGIAGNQAGIYPLNSPGGWHIIGRTPVKLFDPSKRSPVRLKTGDQVQFYQVSREEYLELAGGIPHERIGMA